MLTLIQVCNVCKTSVPRVLACNSRAENHVGAEYIIMQKVAGLQLSSVWVDFTMVQKSQIIKELGARQQAWMSIAFKAYGSLCYSQDLLQESASTNLLYVDSSGVEHEDARFSIGPTVHSHSMDFGRSHINFDRGPCKLGIVF